MAQMRLASIKLAGFKSFVDPTVISFSSNLTAVVGPNGCGKSNVIDAVRWVMGESSAKNLRGENATDVIFNGSTQRKPVSQASVELRFENVEGKLLGEYAHYHEISIKRLVTRDGDSQYYINQTRCRKKDITDIFLGTGLGPRSYAIIEQGMISRFIEAKPDDLRIYLEEAAGISKYKERRRETENRIRHTRENLTRLLDIKEELEKQLTKLERQAETAKIYHELKKDESRLQAETFALNYQNLEQELSKLEASILAENNKLEALLAQRQNIETSLEKDRLQLTESRDALGEVQKQFYQAGSDISSLEQRLAHHQTRKNQLNQDFAQTDLAIKQSAETLKQDTSQQEAAQLVLAELEPNLETLTEEAGFSTMALQELEKQMDEWRQNWDVVQHESSQYSRLAEVEKTKITQLESRIHHAQLQIEKLEKEAAQLVSTDLATANQGLIATEQQYEIESKQIDEILKEQIIKRDELRSESKTLTQKVQDNRKILDRLNEKKAQLSAQIEVGLGKDNKIFNDWLKTHNLADLRVAEKFQVEPGFERAVETVLGEVLESICLDSRDALSTIFNDIQQLKTGLIHILIDTAIDKTYHNPNQAVFDSMPNLLSKIQGIPQNSAVYQQLAQKLSSVYVADNLNSAQACVAHLPDNCSIITQDGIWMGQHWVRINRGKTQDGEGVLAKKNQLKLIIEEYHEQQALSQELEENVVTCQQNLQELEKQVESVQKQKFDLQQKLRELGREIAANKGQIDQTENRKRRVIQELQDHKRDFENWQHQTNQSRQLLEKAVNDMGTFEQKRHGLNSNKESLAQQLNKAREQAKVHKDALYQYQIKQTTLKTQLNGLEINIQRQQERHQTLCQQLEVLQTQIAENQLPIPEIQTALEALLSLRHTIEQQLTKQQQDVNQLEAAAQQNEQSRSQLESELEKQRTCLEQLRLKAQTVKVHVETMLENLTKLGETLETVTAQLAQYEPPATEEAWAKQLTVVQNKIERLGSINLAAIEECVAASERKVYLDAQYKDLTDALDALEEAIKKIDNETRDRFKETFDLVNNEFKQTFPKVFGGGMATLELTGEDLLETGISIIARPPGKKNSSIHLLSGGEKALTAVSLVFSIFKLNPAPFCMLDEVDAPLDDNNVGRFCDLVKDMASTVQFIYISHNKVAMEMAHQMQGVTMREPGVSRMVSVDLEQAVGMMEA
jgi:chromosome segregation protein